MKRMSTAAARSSTSNLRDLIAAELPSLITIRHDLHAHPELMYEERRTSDLVQRELKAAGNEFKAGLAGGTGVVAHLPTGGNGEQRKAVGLRADMDALPIEEQTGAVYASKHPGVMHACGHDGHTTILIGASRVLAKIAERFPLPRPVTFIFQPAEEGGAGGEKMVQEGCLTGAILGPPIENMFALHGWPQLAVGKVASRPGPMLAAADRFEIEVRGTGSHAAYPQLSCDPIVAGAAIVQSLQQIASRNVNPLDSIVVSVTQFHAGTTHNIIPGAAQLAGTVRTLLPETQQLARTRLHDIATNIAQAHGCDARVQYIHGYPVTRNDPDAVEIFMHTAGETLGREHVQLMANPVMGGEDFAYYCHAVPSCFFALGLIPHGQTTMPSLHQPTFDFNDDALPIGIEVFCRLAMRP